MKNKEVFDKALETLNNACSYDENAIHALICNRVPCDKSMGEHSDLYVETKHGLFGDNYQLTVMGLVQGLVEAMTGCKLRASFTVNENLESVFQGFEFEPEVELQFNQQEIKE